MAHCTSRSRWYYLGWFLLADLVLFLLLSLFSFAQPAHEALAQYRPAADFLRFERSVDQLRVYAYRYPDSSSLTQLRAQVRAARQAYKRVEFIIAHAYPAFAKTSLNGPPLPRIERLGLRSQENPPLGLQVLDELVAESAPSPLELRALADELTKSLDRFNSEMLGFRCSPGELAYAAQSAVVSVVALSLTGFDTPGSADGVTEAAIVMETLAKVYAGEPAGSSLAIQFGEATAMLSAEADFDSFDRAAFIREHANSLYRTLSPLIDEQAIASAPPTARNPRSAGLFAADFLDPYAFAQLSRQSDSEPLRLLGQRLFHEVKLSATNTISCATCHDPSRAYTDGKVTSLPQNSEGPRRRNAPTLLGAALANRYFYDLRAFTLEQQAEHVLFDPDEFASNYTQVITRLAADSTYTAGFAEAYPNDANPITRSHLAEALASFVISLTATNTPVDEYLLGQADELADDVQAGFNLFMGKAACGTCHFAPTFSGLVPPHYLEQESEVLGILSSPSSKGLKLDEDLGRAASPIRSEDTPAYEHAFKTVSVREVARTAPYFHHGEYQTLRQVLEFYDVGGGVGHGLEVPNQTLSSDSLQLSTLEFKQLEAFLRALQTSQ